MIWIGGVESKRSCYRLFTVCSQWPQDPLPQTAELAMLPALGRKTDFFGVGRRLSLTPASAGWVAARAAGNRFNGFRAWAVGPGDLMMALVSAGLRLRLTAPGWGHGRAALKSVRAMPNPRPEDRRPKETRRPKSELITTPAELQPIESGHSRNSDFGLLSDFGLRSLNFRAAEQDLPSTGRTLEQPWGHGEAGRSAARA